MKKLWNKYSYAITLIILSCSLTFILSFQHHINDSDQYVKITISEGDSLWKISNQYSSQHSLSNDEFISWIKKHNENISDQIFPGEEIIIPVSKRTSTSGTELASAPQE
ncbi:LysM peptidoglycan-binding domain-containing protein [Neobacillus sp. MM2021_6]|uniref:cell division suppressor protein YneA n=1 Tax=Bacillaceae TaxID=186817 RepID=UPI001A93DC61|nr:MULTISPECIES: LysM peptidoglycan-binding domain-containing protein [Bacillaceae]MBO0962732.1 LysM peptidoglycan-binding domain-containing protein [Neobacillus sp. MM2021_6]